MAVLFTLRSSRFFARENGISYSGVLSCGLSPFLTQPRLRHGAPREGKASEGTSVLAEPRSTAPKQTLTISQVSLWSLRLTYRLHRQLMQDIGPEQVHKRSRTTPCPLGPCSDSSHLLIRSGIPRSQEKTSNTRQRCYLFQVIGEFVVRVHEEDVLRLEVSVSEFIVMQN